MGTPREDLEYVGFWARTGAMLIDTILLSIVIYPLLTLFYGEAYWLSQRFIVGPFDFLLSWVFPAVAVILFWMKMQATPGKLALGVKIVDAKTGNPASTGKLVIRYFAYALSMVVVGLGFLWIAFDSRKQGLHDKIAGTVVVRKKNRGPEPVLFNE